MADDFAAIAAIKPSFSDAAGPARDFPDTMLPRSIAERAEGPIQLISRWAGILVFCAALGAIAYLIF